MLEITFKSSIGKLNALYHHSKNVNAPVAIVVGSSSMDSRTKSNLFSETTDAIAETFIENDFSTLKFSFRELTISGKKDTEKEADNLLDLTTALDWLHSKNIESKSFWVCGLDTGVIATLQLVMRRPEIENYILVSPNIRKDDLDFIVPCSASGLLVRGSEDLRFLEEDCINLQEKLITKTESKIKYMTVYNAERDYKTELGQLKSLIGEYLKEKMEEDRKNMRSIIVNKRRRRKKKMLEADEGRIVYVNPIKPLDIDNI
ncbi:MAG: hypothetical protein IJ853_03240 [Rickettsiales bacterium]|nr:hypothetical protein [Rickettsiales bacterium]